MIVSCPQCLAKFNISTEILGAGGKTVRCSICQESWFQEPDPDEFGDIMEKLTRAETPPLEDIPEGVKPLQDGANVPALPGEGARKGGAPQTASKKKSKILGFAAAGALCLISLGVFASLSAQVMKTWPASYAIYKYLGKDPYITGQGLVFDRLSLHANAGALVVEGYIVNLTSSQKTVPAIKATLMDQAGAPLDIWIIQLPQAQIAKEETISFTASYPDAPPEAKTIELQFTLAVKTGQSAKTASTSGDDTEAHHESAHAAKSGDAAHAESPAHASALPHQESSHVSPVTSRPHSPPRHTDGPEDHAADQGSHH